MHTTRDMNKTITSERQSDILLGYMLAMKDWVLPKTEEIGRILTAATITFDKIEGTVIGESLRDIVCEQDHSTYNMIAQMHILMEHAKHLDNDRKDRV